MRVEGGCGSCGSRGLCSYCLARPYSGKDGVPRCRVANKKSESSSCSDDASDNHTSEEGLILAGRRKMKICVIEEHVNGNGVIHRNLHDGIRIEFLDGVAIPRNIQFLRDLENIVANLLFVVAIHHREARLFLHFVGELIIRYIDRHDFDRGIDNEQDDRQDNDSLELALAPFGAAVRRYAALSDAFKLH